MDASLSDVSQVEIMMDEYREVNDMTHSTLKKQIEDVHLSEKK